MANKHRSIVENPDPHGSTSYWKVGSGAASSDKLDPEPDPYKIADDKPKCKEYGPI
jgi:hypothetical protein